MPLREGGSLPGLVEADDDGLYVLKFRGAGQGPKALVAELICGLLARSLGLPVPEVVLMDLDPELARAEPDPEIQELIEASGGLNLGMDFLPGSLAFVPAVAPAPDPSFAADVVWFDAFVLNVDRTPRNPNLLVWHGRTWLIDHGAALYVHHGSADPVAEAGRPFEPIREHVLLPFAESIEAADERLVGRIDGELVEEVVAALPEDWVGANRGVYAAHLLARLEAPRAFVAEAERARQALVAA
jgi:hypothetical protein